MKNKITLALIAFTSFAFSQTGSLYIGGNVGFSSTTNNVVVGNDASSRTITFAPEAGTFLKDNLQLGMGLNFSSKNTSEDNSPSISTTTFAPVIYARKFTSITDGFSLYYGGKIFFGITSNNQNVKTNSFGVGLPIGAAFAVAPRFGIVGEYGLLSYSTTATSVNGNETTTATTFDFGVNTLGTPFTVGIYYTFKQ